MGLLLGVLPAASAGVSDDELVAGMLTRLCTRSAVLMLLDGFDATIGEGLARLVPSKTGVWS